MHRHTHTHPYIYKYKYMYIYIYEYKNIYIYIFTVIYIYLHIRICLRIMTYIHLHLFVCIYTSYKFSIQCAYHVLYFPLPCADVPSRLIFLRRVQNINQNHGSFGFGLRLADVKIKTTNHNVPKPMNDLQF